MLNNTSKNSSCDYTEQLISYFYDETNQAEKAAFDAHLTNCLDCTDELAGFGFVRSSIIEWRDEEFSNLNAPVFEIPAIKAANQTIKSDSRSWLSDFRRLFSFNPMAAAAVFTALTVCAGLVFLAVKSSNNWEVAGIDNKNSEKIAASPTVGKINEEPKETIAESDSDNSSPGKSPKSTGAAPKNSQPLTAREKRLAAGDSVVRASSSAKDNTEKLENNRNMKETNRENKKRTAQKQTVPSLTTLDDEEDKTVRLADLFDEIDAK